MGFALPEKALEGGYRLVEFETVGSTNAEALNYARAGDPGPVWVVTDEQTAGRGRRGRPWATPKGNLGASLLITLDASHHNHAATAGFAAGLALHGALERLIPGSPVRLGLDGGALAAPGGRFALKWPNDLVAGGAKVAGILLESHAREDGRLAVVIGIGVNVVHPPEDVPYPVTSLTALGVEADAARLFSELADCWMEVEAAWAQGRGMGRIREMWLERSAGLGEAVAVKYGERVLRGTFESIDEGGRLLVRLPEGGVEAIAAAEVHFGAVASANM